MKPVPDWLWSAAQTSDFELVESAASLDIDWNETNINYGNLLMAVLSIETVELKERRDKNQVASENSSKSTESVHRQSKMHGNDEDFASLKKTIQILLECGVSPFRETNAMARSLVMKMFRKEEEVYKNHRIERGGKSFLQYLQDFIRGYEVKADYRDKLRYKRFIEIKRMCTNFIRNKTLAHNNQSNTAKECLDMWEKVANEPSFNDCIIRCSGAGDSVDLPANSSVLKAKSAIFRAMLSSEMRESNFPTSTSSKDPAPHTKKKIELPTDHPLAVQAFLQLLMFGRIDEENLEKILKEVSDDNDESPSPKRRKIDDEEPIYGGGKGKKGRGKKGKKGKGKKENYKSDDEDSNSPTPVSKSKLVDFDVLLGVFDLSLRYQVEHVELWVQRVFLRSLNSDIADKKFTVDVCGNDAEHYQALLTSC